MISPNETTIQEDNGINEKQAKAANKWKKTNKKQSNLDGCKCINLELICSTSFIRIDVQQLVLWILLHHEYAYRFPLDALTHPEERLSLNELDYL